MTHKIKTDDFLNYEIKRLVIIWLSEAVKFYNSL
jgi:hypothetical protein